MNRLRWSARFEMGVKSIDDEHRSLFALAKAVPAGLAAHSGPEISVFIEAAKEHFVSEEKILLMTGFPGLEEHREYHSSMMRRAEALRLVCGSEENPSKSAECYEEIMGFLLDDIIRGDTAFKSFFQYHGLAGTA